MRDLLELATEKGLTKKSRWTVFIVAGILRWSSGKGHQSLDLIQLGRFDHWSSPVFTEARPPEG